MTKCFVIGNSTIDKTFLTNESLKFGESILSFSTKESIGGKGVNQAVAIARCGIEVDFISSIGTDHQGQTIENVLMQEEMKLHLYKHSGASDQSVIIVNSDGENAIVTSKECISKLDIDLLDKHLVRGTSSDYVLLQGNLNYEATHQILLNSKKLNMTTIVNPSPIQFEYDSLWQLIDIIVLNEHEFCRLTRERDVLKGMQALYQPNVKHIIVTRSKESVLHYSGDVLEKFEVPKTEVVDTSGAGDLFCGILVGAFLKGITISESIAAAISCASLSTTKIGTLESYPPSEVVESILDSPYIK